MKIYPKGVIEKFDFHIVLSWIEKQCLTPMAKDIVNQLTPYHSYKNISRHLLLTKEMMTLLEEFSFPISCEEDVSSFLSLFTIEGYTASIEQLMIIRQLANSIRDVRKFVKEKEHIDNLQHLIYAVVYEKQINQSIDQVLTIDGKVKNKASNVLAVIREEQEHIKHSLNRVFLETIRKYSKLNYLTETKESIRNGRRVLTVKAEYKRKIKGVVHDISETGHTAFIEPDSAMQLTNELINLQQDERAEILRILKELTKELRPHVPIVATYEQLLGRLDFTRAKARVAIAMNATIPNFVENPCLSIKGAYHPVLKKQNDKANKTTQSLAVKLDKANRIIVISGPNAGGKSVAMKTIGLLQLMIQSGIPVPVESSSTMGMFTQFFAEIGDEQSIEDELSTYSSKLKTMNQFLQHANQQSIVFIDEFGSGTDPNLGGAIAQAILENLNLEKVYGVITTHYTNIKAIANDLGGLKNAAMLFDEESLTPLYTLKAGKPGSSYTFAIAQISGLPNQVIKRAKQLTGATGNLDDLLTDTQKSQTDILLKQMELDQKLKTVEAKEREVEQLKQAVKKERTKYKINEKNKELEILAEVKKRFDEYVKTLQQANHTQDVEQLRESLRNELKTTKEVLAKNIRFNAKSQAKQGKISKGDIVKWIANDSKGKVLSIKQGKAEVQIGLIRSRIPLEDLILASEGEKLKKQQNKTKTILNTETAKVEIDIRGMRYEEANTVLHDFFDQAIVHRMQWLRVLHGKGNGTLKQLTKTVAHTYKPTSVSHPHAEEGGDGITIVEF